MNRDRETKKAVKKIKEAMDLLQAVKEDHVKTGEWCGHADIARYLMQLQETFCPEPGCGLVNYVK